MRQKVIVVLSLLLFLSFALSVWIFCRTYLIDRITIRGHSMEPTLYEGEKVWVNKRAKYARKIGRNDLIVFCRPDNGALLCKRCIAGPGDSVLFIRSPFDTTLYSHLLYAPAKGDSINLDQNNLRLYEGFIAWEIGSDLPKDVRGYRFTHDWYYFLGDNREHSVDSRHFGLIPYEYLFGKLLYSTMSIEDEVNTILASDDRGKSLRARFSTTKGIRVETIYF